MNDSRDLGIVESTIQPKHVCRISGLLLATEGMIAEAPKEEEHSHGVPGGGMGGMDM